MTNYEKQIRKDSIKAWILIILALAMPVGFIFFLNYILGTMTGGI